MSITFLLVCYAITLLVGSYVLGRVIARLLVKRIQKREQLLLLTALKWGVISTAQYETLIKLAGFNTATLSKLEEKADEFFDECMDKNFATCEEIKVLLDKLKAEYEKKLKDHTQE